MLWNIDKLNCLIVEDDQFKLEGVRSFLNSIFSNEVVTDECHALASATALLSIKKYHIAIIDMSIHSHEPEAGADTYCIILTQYPDIEIESLPIPVNLAKQEIFDKFGIEVAGCVRYLENDNQWKTELENILRIL